MVVFCVVGWPFGSGRTPTSADACGEVTSCDAGCQEVGRCSTRGGFQGMYITFASAKQVNKVRNPKQGYQWDQNRHMCPPKT